MKDELKKQQKRADLLEIEQKKKNLKIIGLPEVRSIEDDYKQVEDLFMFQLSVNPIPQFLCHRIGQKKEAKHGKTIPRPILIKFMSEEERHSVWNAKKLLKDTGIILKEDLPQEIENRAKQLTPHLQKARRMNLKASINRDNLYVEGNKYTTETLNQLPTGLKPSEVAQEETENEVFFWGRNSAFSNFHILKVPFTEDKVQFDSTEKYLQFHKAKYFGDSEAMEAIKLSNDPIYQKRIRVKGFKEVDWQRIAPNIMKEGLRQKFQHNPTLKEALLQTGKKTLVEASPTDSFWAIGCAMYGKKIEQKSKWGRNMLGTLLMEVRDSLK